MKQVISEKDYEKYKIYVPVKLFLNGRQRKYISSCLEKLHPCFSDNFCFDSKYGITKKGICANVVVMDKLVLGEYRANYPGQSLICDEKKDSGVFASKTKKTLSLALVLVPLISGLLIIGGIKKSNKLKNDIARQAEIEMQIRTDTDGSLLDNQQNSIPQELFAYETFFDLFNAQEGKVESLKWKYDGFNEQLSVNVVNCYPEELHCTNQTVEFSSINYVNEKPSFSMNVMNKIVAKNDSTEGKIFDATKDEDYRSKIRDVLKENSVNILNESYLPYKIRFQFTDKNIDGKLFSQIEEVAKKSELFVRGIEINMCEKNIADMEIYFTHEFYYSTEKSILSCIENGWQIFETRYPGKKLNAKEKDFLNSATRIVAVNSDNLHERKERKIGTIIHSNGEKVDFYRTTKGVILNE